MWTSHHPAPGMGELLPGFFVVPQNPLWDNKSRTLAPGGFAGARYIPHIGDILPGRFSVPQNPLIAQVRKGMAGLSGCCSGCSGSSGANPLDADSAYINGQAVVPSVGDVFGEINWLTVAVAAGATYLLLKN